MTTLSQMADEVLQKLSSYGLAQDRLTQLNGALDSSQTSVVLDSVTDIGAGIIEIDTELMYVVSVDTATLTATVIRGFRSTAAAHSDNALVFVNPTWPRRDVERALNDAIVTSYPQLFAVASESFTASAVENTYDLNALTEAVLEVRAQDPTPVGEWRVIDRYRADTNLNLLTIYSGLVPGETFKVVARRRPTSITSAQELTVSGLSESAKSYVVLKATADLVTHMDASRLPVNSAQADDMEQNRTVGSAVRAAQFLYALAERELEAERRRLQEIYPPTVNFSRGRY